MTEVITPALLTGASSAFAECAINAITGFFCKKKSAKKFEINQIEIHRYVDDYLKEQYPYLIDYRYINDKLYEFILEFIKYIQLQINITGNVIINFFVAENSIESSISSFLKLPESQKWNEIELLSSRELSPFSASNVSEKSIETLCQRANKIGLKLGISNNCTSHNIEELTRIVEKYESLKKEGVNSNACYTNSF